MQVFEVLPLLIIPLEEIPAVFGAVIIHPKNPTAEKTLKDKDKSEI